MTLQSYAEGSWHESDRNPAPLFNAITGEQIAATSSDGLDFAGMLDYGSRVGGPALRNLTFHQRALMLKELAKHLMERKDEFYKLSAATGATQMDSSSIPSR